MIHIHKPAILLSTLDQHLSHSAWCPHMVEHFVLLPSLELKFCIFPTFLARSGCLSEKSWCFQKKKYGPTTNEKWKVFHWKNFPLFSGKFCGKCPEGAAGQKDEQGPAAGPCCKGNPQLHWVHCQVREVIFTSTQRFQATPEVLFPVLGSSIQRTQGHNGESPAKGPQRGIRVWSISSRAGTLGLVSLEEEG